MTDFLKEVGTTEVARDTSLLVNKPASWSAQDLRTRPVIPSGTITEQLIRHLFWKFPYIILWEYLGCRLIVSNSLWYNHTTFTFMHLADAFIQSDLFRLYFFFFAFFLGYTFFFISMCVPWELNPRPFALLTQCSTTEPHHSHGAADCFVFSSAANDCLFPNNEIHG